MHFRQIEISFWQQFENISIELHDRLTILTGANGSGKTTLLNIFARHHGWNYTSLATPKHEKNSGVVKFFSRIFNGKDRSNDTVIGKIRYSGSAEAPLLVPQSNAAQYQLTIQNQQTVKCFYIPSHRPIFRYQQVMHIPAQKKDKKNAFDEVSNSNRNRYFGGGGDPNSFLMKNILIGWVINGYGVKSPSKAIMPDDIEQIHFFEGFQKVLKKILPKSINFEAIEIRNMEVVFVCNDGKDEFLLETASGGISALIDIAWQIYMFSTKENNDFTVIIDEVENHLHPTLQRHLLQDLLDAFPGTRFIVSTHSPLIVSSVKDSDVYALRYNDQNKIVSQKLDLEDRAKTAGEILDEVLGVSVTLPVWAEEEFNALIARYESVPVSEDFFRDMRVELSNMGLEKLLPNAISSILGRRK